MTLNAEQRAKFDAVCERIALGESVRQICNEGDDPPCGQMTFYRWLQADETGELQEAYRLAREIQADREVDEIKEIADDARNDWMERRGKDGEMRVELNAENVQRSKLRIQARQWKASKLKPKVYGDKLDLNHGLQDDTDIAALRAEAKRLGEALGIVLPPHITGEAEEDDDEPKDGG